MNNADGSTPGPGSWLGERVGGGRAGAMEPIRNLSCPSPCQLIVQVNYFLGQNSSHVTMGLRHGSQAIWEMTREGPPTFLENGLVQRDTVSSADFSSQRAEAGRGSHLGSGRPEFHPQLSL